MDRYQKWLFLRLLLATSCFPSSVSHSHHVCLEELLASRAEERQTQDRYCRDVSRRAFRNRNQDMEFYKL